MTFKSRFRTTLILLLVIGQFTMVHLANALEPKQDNGLLELLTFVSETLQISAQSEAFDDLRVTAAASGIFNTWDSFRVSHGDWSAIVDKRTGKIDSAEGQGVPFIPGHGNQLQMKDISADLGDDRPIDLARMEAITRAFLPRVTNLLGVDPSMLILNQGRSGQPADYLWFVDFDVTLDGMTVEGARVVFRVNNGNLIQFGSENLPTEGIKAPEAKVSRNQALKSLSAYIGGFSAADVFLDGGSQHLIPVALSDSRLADGFERGKGRGLARIWQFIFRRDGDHGTWRARVDATSGKMLEFRDINDYATAQVTGGVKTSLSESKILPMPFADVSPGVYTNSAGVYNYTSGNVTSALNGQYVKIIDDCGAISMTSDASGNFAFGNSSGTDDCDTPGTGGAGNTRSSRNQFYYLNRAKESARGWLTNQQATTWLNSQLTANVNLVDSDGDGICNAFWNGTTLSLYKKSGSCSNSGEIQGVGFHEFGHGLDANDGNGPSPDKGTGETYGDWIATLMTHDSCIGAGYLSSNCDGFGDACTSCTGVRDIDYAKHVSATPHTVGNFTQQRCPAGGGYNGPCLQEGHCESYISSEALWDLATRDLPNPGTDSAWAIMDRLWYLSRPTATAAFTCFRTTPTWTSDGCGTGSLWKTMRAVDDDDGNLSNGTPNSAALYAAFNRHGIACTSDTGASTSFRSCTQPAVPIPSVAASNNQVTLNWSTSTGVFDVYRNEQGCNAGGSIKVANDLTSSPFTDSNVANDFVYYYRVVAQAIDNEACTSAPSSCLEAAPCSPPAAPASLTATAVSATQNDLTWTNSPGATRYHIYRATTPGGPYIQIGIRSGTTFSDTGLNSCTTYYYVVRAAKNETCESGNSTEAAAPTGDCVLIVKKTPGGTVTSAPAGINCGADCSKVYPYGTTVVLSPTPDVGSEFSFWTGYCAGDRQCAVTMTENKTVKAWFSIYVLYVTKAGPGNGIVTSTPAGINYGLDASEPYTKDTLVTLTASPEAGSEFAGWSGPCSGTGPCTVAMTQQQNVTATFTVEPYTLAVVSWGGTVTSTPAGISCPGDCSEAYSYNTTVTLTANPWEGYTFVGWDGACTGTGTCTVLTTQTRLVTANYSSLSVALVGTGSGTVTSMPAGINISACGVTCYRVQTASFPQNTLVTLTATSAPGSTFDGWRGDCTGVGTCMVTVMNSHTVRATFSGGYEVTVLSAGTGSGTVTSTPTGINCGTDCNEPYSFDTLVTLTATPAAGSVFNGWSGDCTGAGSCSVTAMQNRSLTATFSLTTYSLVVSLAGAGNGTVTSTPTGINCGENCSQVYNYNTPVTLTTTPSVGSVFSGWSGACSGMGTCTVTMTQAQSVTATFSVATDTLTVSLAGTGSGSVTSAPEGINCGTDCSETYNYNTSVTLTAIPAVGSVFSGWSGACSGTGTCTVAMTQARSVVATFSVTTYALTVSLAGTGSGTVTSTPTGINCGTDCSEAYNHNTSVMLAATPLSVLSAFRTWSGACTGTGSCSVTMDQAKSVTATFEDKGQDFYTILPPCRVFDSRITGPQLTSQVPRIINIAGNCGVPATAKAVSLNVTALAAPGDGFITLYPGDIALPGTWTIGFPASLNRANNAVIPLAWNGNGTLAAVAVITGGGTMDMALDVNGYFE